MRKATCWCATIVLGLAGCGGADYARLELGDGRVVVGRVLADGDELRLDTGPGEVTVAGSEVARREPVSPGRWRVAAGAACLEAGKREEGLRLLRAALSDEDRAVVADARRRMQAELEPAGAPAPATVTAPAKSPTTPPAAPAPEPSGPSGETIVLRGSGPARGPQEGPADPEAVRRLEAKLEAERQRRGAGSGGGGGGGAEGGGIGGDADRGEPPIAELKQFLLGAGEDRVVRALGQHEGRQYDPKTNRVIALTYRQLGLWLHFDKKEQLRSITVYLQPDSGRGKVYAGKVCGQISGKTTVAAARELFGLPSEAYKARGDFTAQWNGYELELDHAGGVITQVEVRAGKSGAKPAQGAPGTGAGQQGSGAGPPPAGGAGAKGALPQIDAASGAREGDWILTKVTNPKDTPPVQYELAVYFPDRDMPLATHRTSEDRRTHVAGGMGGVRKGTWQWKSNEVFEGEETLTVKGKAFRCTKVLELWNHQKRTGTTLWVTSELHPTGVVRSVDDSGGWQVVREVVDFGRAGDPRPEFDCCKR